jgi:hypothetical protein
MVLHVKLCCYGKRDEKKRYVEVGRGAFEARAGAGGGAREFDQPDAGREA